MHHTAFALLLCISLLACNRRTDGPGATTYNDLQEQGVKTGGVKMITVHGKYKVWTKRFGNGSIKVLLLHGGPGCTHEYFECFESFFPQTGIEFYEYDQLGSFYSDQPTDTNLWHIPNRVEEVEEVRQDLGLDHFFMLGHSWGGMLGIEYALKYQQH
ncbi:MAG: alpha/beta fold hydrolase, partial [Chitinophagales bacterium]